MSEDSGFNNKNNNNIKPQINTDKRRCGFDPYGSLGIGMFATEALINAPGMTPLQFGIELCDRNVKKGSESIGDSTTECTEMPCNSSGLTPLRPFDEIDRINQKSPLAKDFSAIKSLETLRRSGLTPLGFDSELMIQAQGASPLEGICVRRAQNPQGFGLDERIYPHRKKSSGTDPDQKGE